MAEYQRQTRVTKRGMLNMGDRVTTDTYQRKVDDETGEVTTKREHKEEYKPDES